MEKIVLTIDGKQVSCLPETSILDAAEEYGIKIPNLCHHPSLAPYGACRLCLVEDEKTGRLMASCVTPVAANMSIRTDTPRIKNHRMNIIRLMIAEHPESCVVCSKGNRCQLRQIAAQLGVGETGLYPMGHYKPIEQANPFISRDLNKCILCAKCIRADHELVVVGAIDYNLRGFDSRPATLHDQPLEKSNCTMCGTCVSLCPTGALSARNTWYVGTPQRESNSICGFCGVGCSLVMGVTDNMIVETNPSHQEESVNGSTLCVRGHFAHDFLNARERLACPRIRKNGEMIPSSWDEVIKNVSDRLDAVKKTHGPQSIAFLGSTKCTNEENYLFQKIARVLLKTNNVDNGSYVSGRPVLGVIAKRTESGARVNPLASLEKAQAIFVLGADPNHSVPVVSYYLKRAARKGIPLIVADPRRTELVTSSSVWLNSSPHTDLALINGLSALLLEKGAYDTTFIEQFTEGFSVYRESLSSFTLESVCQVTGVAMESIEKASDLLKGKKIAVVVGHGILEQRYGCECMDAVLNLLLMTGSLGNQNGGGIYCLARENNQCGAWDMGVVPDSLPGRMPLNNDQARKHWEMTWESKLSPDCGLNLIRMIEEAEKGTLKALYILGENPLRSLPQPDRVREALSNLEFLVVQDILENETTQMADVVLPGAAFSEKGGSFTNMEGRIQIFEPVVTPPGDARPDWQILDLLALQMGSQKSYGSVEKIRREISENIPLYAALEGKRDVVWIEEASQKRLFHPEGDGKLISFSPVAPLEDEKPADSYPFTAIFGSVRFHLGSGTRTSCSARIRELGLKGAVELSPDDSERLNFQDGDTVKISSPYGSIKREVLVKKGLRKGLIFVPAAFNNNDARKLIGLTPLGEPGSPGWKECLVKVEKQ